MKVKRGDLVFLKSLNDIKESCVRIADNGNFIFNGNKILPKKFYDNSNQDLFYVRKSGGGKKGNINVSHIKITDGQCYIAIFLLPSEAFNFVANGEYDIEEPENTKVSTFVMFSNNDTVQITLTLPTKD